MARAEQRGLSFCKKPLARINEAPIRLADGTELPTKRTAPVV